MYDTAGVVTGASCRGFSRGQCKASERSADYQTMVSFLNRTTGTTLSVLGAYLTTCSSSMNLWMSARIDFCCSRDDTPRSSKTMACTDADHAHRSTI